MSLPDSISLAFSSMPSINDDDISMLDFSQASEASGTTKISACILTCFPQEQDHALLTPDAWGLQSDIDAWCGQFEIAPKTDALHMHIFVQFKRTHRKRHDTLRKLIESVTGKTGNIQIQRKYTKKAKQCAVNYVLKPGGVGTPFIWNNSCVFDEETWLARPKPKKSKEERLDEQIDWIESRPKHWTWDQLVHECDESKRLLAACSWGKSYHAGRLASAERRTIKDVVVMYGAGGTGKTTMARSWDTTEGEDEIERYFKRNHDDGHFWGGGRVAYKGQRIIHFEEFSGNEQFSNMKEWCDIGKTGPPVNVKNGGSYLNHETVLITTNVHPAGWYADLWNKDPKQFHPFWRRITRVMFFPERRPDGSLNIPNETTEPYWEDQTVDWISMAGDYNACKRHSQAFWPLETTGVLDDRGARALTWTWP